MGIFFKIETEADKALMEGYDQAVLIFRAEVSQAMEEAAHKEPSIAVPLLAAAEALRLRPLPSEVNRDPAALRRLALSSLTIEMMFAKMQVYADSQQALDTVSAVVTQMREIGKQTTARPEFKPLTAAAIAAVSEVKPQLAAEMDAMVFDLHLGELRKSAATGKNPAPPANRGPGQI